MTEIWKYLSSTTVQGALLSAINLLLIKMGWVGLVTSDEVSGIFSSVLGLIGLGMTVYGRKKAEGPL